MSLILSPSFVPGTVAPAGGALVLDLANPSIMAAVKTAMAAYAILARGLTAPANRVLSNVRSATWTDDDSALWSAIVPGSTWTQAYKGTSQPTATGLCGLLTAKIGSKTFGSMLSANDLQLVSNALSFWMQDACGARSSDAVVKPTDNIGPAPKPRSEATAQPPSHTARNAFLAVLLVAAVGGTVMYVRSR